MPSLRLISNGEKSDSFSDLAMVLFEGDTMKELSMNKPTKPPTMTPGTSRPMTSPAAWDPNSQWGFQAFNDTTAGRLVRLGDVFWWLRTHPSPKPHEVAFDALCDAMPSDVMQWLYELQPGKYAKPVPPDCMFGGQTAAQIEQAKTNQRQAALQREHERVIGFIGKPSWSFGASRVVATKQPEPVAPGLPALLRCMKGYWRYEKFNRAATVAVQDDPRISLTRLAVPFDKAAQHWGWGRVLGAVASEPVTFDDVVALRKAEPGTDWTRQMVEVVRAEVRVRVGQKGVRTAIGGALGVSAARVGELLSKDWQPSPMRTNSPALRSVKS